MSARRLGAAALCALNLLLASSAGAQPSVWDAARDPAARREYEVLVALERILSRDELEPFDPTLPQRLMRAALTATELAAKDETSDVRLRFIAGDLLSDSLVGRDREAREVLRAALREAPTSPLAGRAWFNVAIASARLGEPEEEHRAYTQALELVWERGFRANILTNRGESAMVLGRLEPAILDYREAIRLADRPDMQALAHYGLGITLERSGDLPAALAAMRVANGIQIPGIGSSLDLPGVFFVPAYDVHYYKALAAMAAARDAEGSPREGEHLLAAMHHWSDYLAPATAERHRWVPNARRHLERVKKRLAKLGPRVRQRGASRAR